MRRNYSFLDDGKFHVVLTHEIVSGGPRVSLGDEIVPQEVVIHQSKFLPVRVSIYRG